MESKLYIVMMVQSIADNLSNIGYMKTFTNIFDAIDTYNSLFTKFEEIRCIDKTKFMENDDIIICKADDFRNCIIKSVSLNETICDLDELSD